jgi:hypothetical protein
MILTATLIISLNLRVNMRVREHNEKLVDPPQTLGYLSLSPAI